jgi:hypothetical protein
MGPARSGRYPGSSRCIGGRCGRLWPARFRRSRAAEAGCCDPNSSTLSWRPTARFRGSSGTRRIGSGCDCARCLKSKSRSHRFGGTCAHARWPWALLGHEISVLQSCEFGGEAQVDWYEGWVQFDGVRKTYIFCMRGMAGGGAFHRAYPHAHSAGVSGISASLPLARSRRIEPWTWPVTACPAVAEGWIDDETTPQPGGLGGPTRRRAGPGLNRGGRRIDSLRGRQISSESDDGIRRLSDNLSELLSDFMHRFGIYLRQIVVRAGRNSA